MLRPVQYRGEPGDGGRLEELPHGQLHAQGAADAAGQPGGEQGVAAEVEEVVVDGQAGNPEHLDEEGAQDLLARPARSASRDLPGVGGGGQRLVVELAVGRQRQGVQGDERRGQHVVRQLGGGMVVERAGTHVSTGHHVRDEPQIARDVLTRHHGHVVDRGVGREHGLDLAELDPEAADLHLLVGAPQVVEAAVAPAPGQVARAVHPGARLAEARGVRVGGEAVRGEARASQVAAGETGPGDVHLPGYAGRDGAQPVVEDVDPQVGDVDADGARRGGGSGGPVQREVGDVDGGFGDAVHVDQDRGVLGVPLVPVREARQVECLAAEHHVAQGEFGPLLTVGRRQLVERRGRLVQDGDPLLFEQGQERGGVPADGVRYDDEPAAVQERPPQLPDGEVERVGVEEGPHVLLVEAEPVLGGGEEPHDVLVRHGHALGPPRRARGVDDVRGVPWVERPDPFALGEVVRAVRAVAVRSREVAEDDAGHLVGGQPPGGVAVGEQHRGRRVGQRVGEPVGRIAGVERHIGGTRLDHGEQRHDQFRRAGQCERDQRVGPDPAGDEQPGEAVGPRVELAVREGGALEGQRRAVGVAGRLLLEELRQRGRDGRGGLAGSGGGARQVGRHEQLVVFAGDEDVDVAQARVGLRDDLREEPHQPLGEGADGSGVEQLRAELHREVQPGRFALGVAVLVEGEHEVEPGQTGVHGHERRAEAGQPVQLAQGVLLGGVEGQRHLEQRVVGRAAVRVERLDEPLEGHVLVGVGGQVAGADPAEELAEGRVAAGVRAQHERVDEEADQVLHGRVGTPRDGGADRYVLTRAEPCQEPGERGLEHHEHAGPGLGGQPGQRAVQVGGHGQVEPVPGVVPPCGTRPVGGQFEPLRQAGQGLSPVRELPGALALAVLIGAEEFVLPERVVGVLHRQRRPLGGRAAEPGGVGGPQITGERGQRPAVPGDVVQHQQQHVLVRRHPQQRGAQRHFTGDVERMAGHPGDVLGQPLRVAVDDLQAGRRLLRGQDHLVRAVLVLREHGAQALVPGDHVTDRRRQGGAVHPAGEPQRGRDVVQR